MTGDNRSVNSSVHFFVQQQTIGKIVSVLSTKKFSSTLLAKPACIIIKKCSGKLFSPTKKMQVSRAQGTLGRLPKKLQNSKCLRYFLVYVV